MDWKAQFVSMLFPLNSSEMRIEVAYLIKYQNLPQHLYKYKSVDDNSKKNLRDGTVWLANPESFNDPYDCAHMIDFSKWTDELFRTPPSGLLEIIPSEKIDDGLLDSLQLNNSPTNAFIDSILASEPRESQSRLKVAFKSAVFEINEDRVRSFAARMKTAFRLCSFSERIDSTLMWAHYANSHRGFCVQYNVKNISPDQYASRFMYPVIYSDSLLDITEHLMRGVDHSEFNCLFPNQMGLRKACDWAYEQEWRLLFSNGLIEKPQAYPMPKPEMVYLGSHIAPSDEREIIDICNAINVPVKKMQHSVAEYKMLAVPLDEANRQRFGQRA